MVAPEILRRLGAGISRVRRNGLRAAWRERRSLVHGFFQLFRAPRPRGYAPETPARALARAGAMRRALRSFRSRPRISLVVAVSDPGVPGLCACIESVLTQVYPEWDLCLAVDRVAEPAVLEMIEASRRRNPRVRVLRGGVPGSPGPAIDAAFEQAAGEFVALVGQEDRLAPDALFEIARAIDEHPGADVLYSDEDRVDETGARTDPYFKPDWSPELLAGCMYLGRLCVYRSALVRDLGGMRAGRDGSGEHDLALRAVERTSAIRHIPRVLYHRGSSAAFPVSGRGRVEGDFGEATLRVVQEALDRRGEGGRAALLPGAPGFVRVTYPVRGEPLVSVIIPTRDGAEVLRTCLESLFTLTGYRRFEVIVVDNGSAEPATFALFAEYRGRYPDRFRVERLDIPFNFSRLNNRAATLARGELLLLLNSDVEIVEPAWLEALVGQALRPSVGFAGAVLLYPDRTIQHAGVVLGIGGVAGHSHKYLPGELPGYFGRLRVASNCSAATAACLLVRASTYRRVGGLDEEFTVAFNDVDFCLRVRALGLLGVIVPEARLVHHESKSRGAEDTPEKRRRFRDEIERMQSRWGPLLRADPYYNRNLSHEREDFSLAADDVRPGC